MNLLESTCYALSKVNLDNVKIYNTKSVTPLFDYCIIATSQSSRQLDASVSNIEDEMYKNGFKIRGVEGKNGGSWILIDLNEVLVHIFYQDEREAYNLDSMWRNLETLDFDTILSNIK